MTKEVDVNADAAVPETHRLRECLLLTPFSGFENLPEALPSREAAEILGGWLALWHPVLIAQTRSSPRMQSAEQPPYDFQGVLALLPECAKSQAPSALDATARSGGGWLLPPSANWRDIQSQILTELDLPQALPVAAPTLQLDFASLGYAYLQIQLLTRQLHYTSNLDQVMFDTQLTDAAVAALAGDVSQADRMLQSCFDQLGQERDHYYSLDVSLVDVTLLAATTLGTAVGKQLKRDLPTTFVASATLLRQMQSKHSDSFDTLQRALTDRRASLAGGLDVERPHPLMSFDTVRRDLIRGKAAYQALGLEPPTVFTRFSFGQMSDMPLHLRRSGYAGAMLIAWEGGSYPSGSHAKFSWEAAEGTFLNAVAPPLVDAQDASTYLALGRRIADALDHQHVPIFMLAHWPDHYSPFFELVEQVVKRTPALGRWQTIDDFFEKTDQPYHQEHLPPRKFVYDWLTSGSAALNKQTDELIQATCWYHKLSSQLRRLHNVACLCYQLENYHSRKPARADALPADAEKPAEHPQSQPLDQLHPELVSLADRIDALLDDPASAVDASIQELANELDKLRLELTARFARAIGHRPQAASSPRREDAERRLLINATSAPRRIPVNSPVAIAPSEDAKWLYASGASSADRRLSMIDMPAFATLVVPLGRASAPAKRKQPTLVPGDGLLQNDFLEVQVDPKSGAMRSLHVPGKRGNRLSCQLARRDKQATTATYSQMRAESIETLENSTVRGLVRACGKLVFDERNVADFVVDYEVLRGDRVLRLNVQLNNATALAGSPWASAYVLRTAWPNESSILTTRHCSSRSAWTSGKALATEWIEIDDVDYRTYILPQGLAFHSRVEERFMESILSIGGRASLGFQLGIAVDLPNPAVAAMELGQPALEVALETANSPASAPAWLMHVDARTVQVNLESALLDANGACVGMRIHVTELIGKSVTAKIRALREIGEAHRVDYLGGRIAKLTVEGDTVTIALRPSEMTFIDLLWSQPVA